MMGCIAAAPLWDMDAIMAKPCLVLMVFVVTFALFLPEVAADIGKAPTITLHIQKNGERATGDALMCYDTSMHRRPGYQAIKDYHIKHASKDALDIKEHLENKPYISCWYCLNGECEEFFDELLRRIAILYPAYGFDHSNEATQETIVPHF